MLAVGGPPRGRGGGRRRIGQRWNFEPVLSRAENPCTAVGQTGDLADAEWMRRRVLATKPDRLRYIRCGAANQEFSFPFNTKPAAVDRQWNRDRLCVDG